MLKAGCDVFLSVTPVLSHVGHTALVLFRREHEIFPFFLGLLIVN